MTTIEIGNVGSKEQAEKIVNALAGRTYMHFEVGYSICAGNYPVLVWTTRLDTSEEELRQMVLFCLACEL